MAGVALKVPALGQADGFLHGSATPPDLGVALSRSRNGTWRREELSERSCEGLRRVGEELRRAGKSLDELSWEGLRRTELRKAELRRAEKA